jgi:hypothetical protein
MYCRGKLKTVLRIRDVSSRILGVKKHRIPDPTVHEKRDEK